MTVPSTRSRLRSVVVTGADKPEVLATVEEVRAFVFLLETKYGNNVARAFVNGRLRSESYLDEDDKTYLEGKLREYRDA